ncbi:hypothetical protein [Snodgrassella gandavensis]|uniref:hypothetical protein n=1 Tax=Snodgrassella gandavensis TaxID=2946698 RepID=UPI001EF6DD82|nr:hypothetical protein [Snodgrassella gandavensis]
MANQNSPEPADPYLNRQLIRQTLASWRFLLLMALVPLLWVIFNAPVGFIHVLITGNAGIVIYQCWRLWLDNNYFSELTPKNNQQAGIILAFIWQKEKLQYFSLQQRYEGAIKQLKYALASCAILWLIWVIALLFK